MFLQNQGLIFPIQKDLIDFLPKFSYILENYKVFH
jgi:hypothetical protein